MPTATKSERDRTIEEAQRTARSAGEDPVPAPKHSTRHVPDDFRTINGWGADLDPKNRPMVPAELPSDVQYVRGTVTAWQEPRQKIHISNEQLNLTPAFGETCPPAGFSGALRDYAYEYGEGTLRRWMTLLFADRVDIAGSLFLDAVRGRPDNIIKEKAWPTRLRHRSAAQSRGTNAAVGLAIGLALAGAALAIVSDRRR